MLTGYDFNRIELSLPNASLIFRSAEEKMEILIRLATDSLSIASVIGTFSRTSHFSLAPGEVGHRGRGPYQGKRKTKR